MLCALSLWSSLCYVGAQTACWSYLIRYAIEEIPGMTAGFAATSPIVPRACSTFDVHPGGDVYLYTGGYPRSKMLQARGAIAVATASITALLRLFSP